MWWCGSSGMHYTCTHSLVLESNQVAPNFCCAGVIVHAMYKKHMTEEKLISLKACGTGSTKKTPLK